MFHGFSLWYQLSGYAKNMRQNIMGLTLVGYLWENN